MQNVVVLSMLTRLCNVMQNGTVVVRGTDSAILLAVCCVQHFQANRF